MRLVHLVGGGERVRTVLVRVRVGDSALIARLTSRAAHELAIQPGQPIWLQVKSVALVE